MSGRSGETRRDVSMRCSALFSALLGVVVCVAGTRAGDWPGSCLPADEASTPPKGGAIWSVQFLSGHDWLTGLGPRAGPLWEHAKLDYLPQAFRIGCECPHVLFPGCWLQGTYEALLEYSVSPILRDFGSYLSGPCAIVRYNYRHDGSCLIPYLQGGAGLLLNDAYHEQRQRLVGQSVEFLLRVEFGVRFLLTERFS